MRSIFFPRASNIPYKGKFIKKKHINSTPVLFVFVWNDENISFIVTTAGGQLSKVTSAMVWALFTLMVYSARAQRMSWKNAIKGNGVDMTVHMQRMLESYAVCSWDLSCRFFSEETSEHIWDFNQFVTLSWKHLSPWKTGNHVPCTDKTLTSRPDEARDITEFISPAPFWLKLYHQFYLTIDLKKTAVILCIITTSSYIWVKWC